MGVFHVFLIVQMAPNHATHQIWPNEISLKNMAFLEIISPSHNTKNQTNLMNSFISSEKKNRKDRQRQRDESKTIGPNIKSGHPITKNKHMFIMRYFIIGFLLDILTYFIWIIIISVQMLLY